MVAKVWKYFTILESDKNRAQCNNCGKSYSAPRGATNGLLKHLESHSKEDAQESREDSKRKNGPSSSSASVTEPKQKQPKLDMFIPRNNENTQKLLDQAIVQFLAESGVAFRVTDLESFRQLFAIVNNKVKIKSRVYYSKLVSEAATEVRKDILNIIQFVKNEGVDTISFTTDGWTSSSGDPFLCLTMQFIYQWRIYRFVPFVKPLGDLRHTGINISLCLDEMIESLGLGSDKFNLFSVNDNASNMKLAIRLSEYLTEYSCKIHWLELALKDALKATPSMMTVLSKSKKIAKFSNKSTVAAQKIKEACKIKNLSYRKMLNPPNTRWHGFFQTLQSVLYLKPALMYLFSESDVLDEHVLNKQDWKLIEAAVTLLKPFCDTVKAWEAESEPTITKVTEQVYNLNENMSDFIRAATPNSSGHKLAKELKKNLNIRFPDNATDNVYNCIGNFLAPQYKGVHLKISGKYEETKVQVKKLLKHFSTEAGHCSNISPTAAEAGQTSNMTPTERLLQRERNKRRTTMTEESAARREDPLEKEFLKYDTFTLAPPGVDPLQWWKDHEKVLPLLARAARSVFTIPASSAKSERVFSCAGNFATKKRSRLGLAKLEELCVIKENKKHIDTFNGDHPEKSNTAAYLDYLNVDVIYEASDDVTSHDDEEHDLLCDEVEDDDEDSDFLDEESDDDDDLFDTNPINA